MFLSYEEFGFFAKHCQVAYGWYHGKMRMKGFFEKLPKEPVLAVPPDGDNEVLTEEEETLKAREDLRNLVPGAREREAEELGLPADASYTTIERARQREQKKGERRTYLNLKNWQKGTMLTMCDKF